MIHKTTWTSWRNKWKNWSRFWSPRERRLQKALNALHSDIGRMLVTPVVFQSLRDDNEEV